MITSRRIYILAVLILLLSAYVMQADAGDKCKGASCDPHPAQAEACKNNADNKIKCPKTPVSAVEHHQTVAAQTPFAETPLVPLEKPDVPPPCGYLNSVPCDDWQPPNEPLPSPTMPPPYASPTRQLAIQPCYPVTDLGPDDVALLIEAVAEGYSIIIVRDVLATSSDDIIVIGNE